MQKLAKEVNLDESAQKALLYLDVIQMGDEIDDMYGELAEFCLDFRRRVWLKGNREGWDSWQRDKEIIDGVVDFLNEILEYAILKEKKKNQLLASALYVRLARVGRYRMSTYMEARAVIKRANMLDKPNSRNFYGVDNDGEEVRFRLYPASYYGCGEWLWHYKISTGSVFMIGNQPYEEMKRFVISQHDLKGVKEIVGEQIGWSIPPNE
jgi:hypothetical protein